MLAIDRSVLADASEMVASVAILVTLVYLTIEINQNTAALNGQAREAVLGAAQSELQLMIETPRIINNLIGAEPLTSAEQIELDSMLTLLMRSREFSWLQYQDGTIDELQWETEHAVLLSILDADRTRQWWGNLGRHVFGKTFVGYVDQTMSNNPATNKVNKASSTWAD